MSRVALMGGSFNPPHIAHQMVCVWALSTARAEEVWLVPCYRHPFNKALADFGHRVAMCELAATVFAHSVRVSDVERSLDGDGRTLTLVKHLRERHPEHDFSLLIGADILAEKDSWYRFDEIERLVRVEVVGRRGYRSPPGSVELPEVSSTAIRTALAAGESVDGLVPQAVGDYIETHALYREAG